MMIMKTSIKSSPLSLQKHRCGILSDGNMPGNDDDGDDDDDDDDERASIGKTGSSFGSFVRDPCSIN